jgi:hypothetical protein
VDRTNRYLDVVPARPPFAALSVVRNANIVATAMAALLAVWAAAVGSPVLYAIGPILLFVYIAGFAWRSATRKVAVREILTASDLVLTESFEDARTHIARVLAMPVDMLLRAETLALLARCASMRGDLDDAEALIGRALECLRARSLARNLDAIHLASQLLPQRAFALVVSGNLEAAAAVLDAPSSPNAHPAATALALRARALLLWRQGKRDALLTLLANSRATAQAFLTLRDRTFLHVLEAGARGVAGEARVAVEPDIARWIERAAPDLASTMVTA